jgi:hypothetical protein
MTIRPARGPSADLQDGLFELVEFCIGQLCQVGAGITSRRFPGSADRFGYAAEG